MANLHATANARSELVTQVILGTPLVVGKEKRGWLWVTIPDAYRGWIAASATRCLKLQEPRYASQGRVAVVTSNIAVVHVEGYREPRTNITATIGTRMELVKRQRNKLMVRLSDGRIGWAANKDAEVRAAQFRYRKTSRRKVVETAKRFFGVPYLWGGTTPFGFDCSGFVQLVYRLNGVEVPRDANQQLQVAAPLSVEDLKPADLLFFSNRSSGITHVGIFAGGGKFIHAFGRSNRVTITPFNDRYFQSIFVRPGRVPSGG